MKKEKKRIRTNKIPETRDEKGVYRLFCPRCMIAYGAGFTDTHCFICKSELEKLRKVTDKSELAKIRRG